MPDIVFLGQADVADLLDPDALRPALAEAFRRFSAGETSAPPRSAAVAPNGLVGTMPAYLPGAGISVKLVAVYPGNHARGVPSHQALIAVFVLAGTRPGRTSAEEITVYKSTGHAVEDAAAARLVLDRALQTGRGTRLTL
jgi:alanine dehydrogenase